MLKLRDTDRPIVDGIADLLDGAGALKRVRRVQSNPMSLDRDIWAKLAELGWLGAAVPEEQGGVGLGLREIMLLLEHAGQRLMPEPLVLALAGSMILARCSDDASQLLAAVIAGTSICVPVEAASHDELTAKAGKLDGLTGFVSDGHVADIFLVLADVGGVSQVLAVPCDVAGLTVESQAGVDGGSITRLRFKAVALSNLSVLAKGAVADEAFAAARDLARLGYAALLTGLMDAALAMTVQYMKDRKQFGVPIGSFQALQHRAASLSVVGKTSSALLYEACRAVGSRRSMAALAAKSYASESAMQTVKECVQLHGAMGYTAEHDMSLFFRRAMALSVAGGDAISCRKQFHAERQLIQEF
jgi:alkylation response protein AidB-like acyl-CoA dehydrogenase